MKYFEMQPIYENVLNTFEEDALNRNIDVLRFAELINSMDTSCSIALDARWGAGKTFFVKQVKMVFDAFNDHIDVARPEDKDRIRKAWERIRVRNKPELQPHVSVYYDAWANDNDEDPVLSLVYVILQSVSADFSFKQKPGFLDVAAGIMEAVSGRSLTTVLDALKSKDPMATIRAEKGIRDRVSEFLNALLPERGNRLVVFVDELDRCNPSFAVKLLERIKHYFNNGDITFVFSVNIGELQHVVRSYYGERFDACRYLDRFFDLRIDLPPADFRSFYHSMGLQDTRWVYEAVCKIVIDMNRFSLRETARFYRMARAAAYKPLHDSKTFSFCFAEEKAVQFCLMYLVPIMIGLKISDYSKYEAFVEGRDKTPLLDVFKGNSVGRGLCNDLLTYEETFSAPRAGSNEKTVLLEDKLGQLYEALFLHQFNARDYEVQVGNLSVTSETRTTLLRAVSTLSEFADYEI